MVESVSMLKSRSSTTSAKLKCITCGGAFPNWLGAEMGRVAGGAGGSGSASRSTLMLSASSPSRSESWLGLRDCRRGRRIALPKTGAGGGSSTTVGRASSEGDGKGGLKAAGGPAGGRQLRVVLLFDPGGVPQNGHAGSSRSAAASPLTSGRP